MNPFGDFKKLNQASKDKIRKLVIKHMSEELPAIKKLQKELQERIERAKLSKFILSLLD